MKIETKSTFGNFSILAEADVTDEQRDALANLGFLQLLQRSPASAAEKAMAGYEKRPEGFKRNSIPFSQENADKLTAALEKPIGVGEGITDIEATVVVSEYVPTVADVKLIDERNSYVKFSAANRGAEVATKVGYSGELGDGTSENAPVEFLRAIRAWKMAQDVMAD